MRAIGWFAFIFLVSFSGKAQQVDTLKAEPIEDYSMYAEAELAGGSKRFCTSKIFDLSPNKLISIGYDFQGSYQANFGSNSSFPSQSLINQNNYGLRLAANVPVVSKTNVLLNLGATYWENFYNFQESAIVNPLAQSLQKYGLRTMGVNFTLFKPFNEKKFLIVFGSADLNGNYSFSDFQSVGTARISGAVVYGWKKHDRLMYGFGLSRNYRIGEVSYFPTFLYNYTFQNRKWGIEALFPARANLRRTFNTRTLGFVGYELEGKSYHIRNRENEFNALNNAELRRSELRLRLVFERSIKNFIWLSLQAGLRYDYQFNLDEEDFFRGFEDRPYLVNNNLGNSLYVNFSINLVSP